jgi:hypothetical protein
MVVNLPVVEPGQGVLGRESQANAGGCLAKRQQTLAELLRIMRAQSRMSRACLLPLETSFEEGFIGGNLSATPIKW